MNVIVVIVIVLIRIVVIVIVVIGQGKNKVKSYFVGFAQNVFHSLETEHSQVPQALWTGYESRATVVNMALN